ncbi:MAG: 50S ribosomal protein L4 [Thermodesulfovibrionales bacterium]|nr:50S ribosomal protein L4 [Thermodesulfovibrionales bacterium]
MLKYGRIVKMIEIAVKDVNNVTKEMLHLPERIFGCNASEAVVHTAIRSYLANQRQGTHATKTRGMVSGGGRKPWRQKHTGRARHGSIRSPLWRGGGIVFGPQPRDYYIQLPKKQKRIALYKALTMKLADGEIVVVDSLKFDRPRTKDMVQFIERMGLLDKTVLIVTEAKDNNLILSSRNIPTVDTILVNDLNAYHVAAFDILLFTKEAILKLQDSLSSEAEVA